MTIAFAIESSLQVNVQDISLDTRVLLAVLKSAKFPEFIDAALVKADWIPLHYSYERICMHSALIQLLSRLIWFHDIYHS